MRLLGLLFLSVPMFAADSDAMDAVLSRLYNFDFESSLKLTRDYIAEHDAEPLPFALQSAIFLFQELDRLSILEGEFFADDKRIIEKKKLKPDPVLRENLFRAIGNAQLRAEKRLKADPADRDSLFSMCVTLGVQTDYTALVEKRQLYSLSSAKKANVYAQRLLKIDPQYYDAYLTTGINEYILGSMPFIFRWFVRFEDTKGSKDVGIGNLKITAEKGHYLKPFAKILLAMVYLREKRPQQCAALLDELTRAYPENPLLKKELLKVRARM